MPDAPCPYDPSLAQQPLRPGATTTSPDLNPHATASARPVAGHRPPPPERGQERPDDAA